MVRTTKKSYNSMSVKELINRHKILTEEIKKIEEILGEAAALVKPSIPITQEGIPLLSNRNNVITRYDRYNSTDVVDLSSDEGAPIIKGMDPLEPEEDVSTMAVPIPVVNTEIREESVEDLVNEINKYM